MKNSYYGRLREDIVSKIAGKNLKILELGCGEGVTVKYLAEKGIAKYSVGLDIHKSSIKKAKKYCDEAYCVDLDNYDFKKLKKKFDVIIAADVLEHTKDPWRILKDLKKVLTKNGQIILSVPNVRNVNLLKRLIMDKDWKYGDKGILDKTHLRFFTKKSLVRMVKECGYEIVEIDQNMPELNRPKRLLNWIVGGKLEEWYVVQWVVKAKRAK